eukprot:g15102.t1
MASAFNATVDSNSSVLSLLLPTARYCPNEGTDTAPVSRSDHTFCFLYHFPSFSTNSNESEAGNVDALLLCTTQLPSFCCPLALPGPSLHSNTPDVSCCLFVPLHRLLSSFCTPSPSGNALSKSTERLHFLLNYLLVHLLSSFRLTCASCFLYNYTAFVLIAERECETRWNRTSYNRYSFRNPDELAVDTISESQKVDKKKRRPSGTTDTAGDGVVAPSHKYSHRHLHIRSHVDPTNKCVCDLQKGLYYVRIVTDASLRYSKFSQQKN